MFWDGYDQWPFTHGASNHAKAVVPYEATSLMGAAEVLLSTLPTGTDGISEISEAPAK
jgi:hypothetical protein